MTIGARDAVFDPSALTRTTHAEASMRFTVGEMSGALGDLGTFLPLAAAMAAVNRMDLGAIFLFAGLMNIATGVYFRQPVPVQPMKAIAAVAIAEGLAPGTIAASGIAMGVIMTLLALTGTVNWIDRVVPRPVIRGIQAGVGAKLAIMGVAWTTGLPMLGSDSVALAIAAAFAVALIGTRRIPVILILFLLGLGMAGWSALNDLTTASWAPVSLTLVVPTAHEWLIGLTRGTVPQLPLTLLNSVLAVCALSGDLFPGRAIPPRRMALSVGVMNLLAVPLGGMPMCHGAGGLAAQYRFGARTGGSVVMLGIGKIVFALALGGVLLTVVQAYPRSLLAVMIFFAGVTLMKPAKESLGDSRAAAVMLVTAVIIVLGGTLEGFVAGCTLASVLALVMRHRRVIA